MRIITGFLALFSISFILLAFAQTNTTQQSVAEEAVAVKIEKLATRKDLILSKKYYMEQIRNAERAIAEIDSQLDKIDAFLIDDK